MRISRKLSVRSLWLLVLLALSWSVTPARADLVTYPNFAAWNGAVSGVTTVAIPDPAPDPFIYFGTGTASVTYNGITFSTDGGLSDSSFFNVGMLFSGLPTVLSSQDASTGPENMLISFPVPVYGFALNYGTFDGSDVTFLLSNGDSFTQASTGGSTYGVPDFAGATDTTALFSSVLITSTDPTLDINNISYVASVPEPCSLTLLVSGTVLLIFHKRQRRLPHRSNSCV